jgi:hypothetical protein
MSALTQRFQHATAHAIERIGERYGLAPTAEQWRDAVLDIIGTVAGDQPAAVMLQKQVPGGRTEQWLVRISGVQVVAVYAPAEATIVTVQPRGSKATPWPISPHLRQHLSGRGRSEGRAQPIESEGP